jgi:D-sedoheptulose 7-phosphate isomerase
MTETRRALASADCPALPEITDAAIYFRGLSQTLQHLPYPAINQLAEVLLRAYQDRRALFLFGNGGSAALASHLACDLAKGTAVNGAERFRVLALTDNVPLLTAWANDARYDDIFTEQMRNFIEPGDVAFAISGSGNSANVINGLQFAREAGACTLGLAGYEGGKMKALCDLCVIVPSENMQVIEDLHLSISHCVFSVVRNKILQLATAAASASVCDQQHQAIAFSVPDSSSYRGHRTEIRPSLRPQRL